jgi:Neprosin
MIINKVLLSIVLVALATPCLQAKQLQKHIGTPHETGDYNPPFVSFGDFLDQVRRARFKDYPNAKVRDKEVFLAMKSHILRMYSGVRSVRSVLSFSVNRTYVDCIAVAEQPTFKLLGLHDIAGAPLNASSAPGTRGQSPGRFSYADSPLKLGHRDEFRNPVSCSKGTIPIARLTLEKLTSFRTLAQFFQKVPREQREPDFLPDWNETHLHVYGFQNVDNYGGNSFLDLWSPSGDFSLSQQWYVGEDYQTIEGGWVVDPDRYNTNQSVLFIYWTMDGYDQTGCFNLDCPGFMQINSNWYLGGVFSEYSTLDGPQVGVELQWKLYSRNWWLFIRGSDGYEAIGYYPTSIYEDGPLSSHADQIEFGGETARKIGDKWPAMGSGIAAERGWSEAAFQSRIFWIPRDENDGVGKWANLTSIDQALSSCYTINLVEAAKGGTWGTYFFYGGSGGDPCDSSG